MKFDSKAIEIAVVASLPGQSRWLIDGTPLDFNFSVARDGLRKLPHDTLENGDPAWANLLVFGEYDYAEGGGAHPWVCVRQPDGTIYKVDPELEKTPMSLLNSSIEHFIRLFLVLDAYFGKNEKSQLPEDCDSRLRTIDPEVYPKSEWQLLVGHVRNA